MLHGAVGLGSGHNDREKAHYGESSGHVEVRRRGGAAVQQTAQERIVAGVQDRVVQQPQQLEYWNHSDRVGSQDECEQRQQKRRPCHGPLVADARPDH